MLAEGMRLAWERIVEVSLNPGSPLLRERGASAYKYSTARELSPARAALVALGIRCDIKLVKHN